LVPDPSSVSQGLICPTLQVLLPFELASAFSVAPFN
jgi:hypothetical protein